jgi:hypothetical protein
MSSVSGAMMIGVAPTSRLLVHRAAARGFEPTIKWTCDSVFHAAINGAGGLGSHEASFIVKYSRSKCEAPPMTLSVKDMPVSERKRRPNCGTLWSSEDSRESKLVFNKQRPQ